MSVKLPTYQESLKILSKFLGGNETMEHKRPTFEIMPWPKPSDKKKLIKDYARVLMERYKPATLQGSGLDEEKASAAAINEIIDDITEIVENNPAQSNRLYKRLKEHINNHIRVLKSNISGISDDFLSYILYVMRSLRTNIEAGSTKTAPKLYSILADIQKIVFNEERRRGIKLKAFTDKDVDKYIGERSEEKEVISTPAPPSLPEVLLSTAAIGATQQLARSGIRSLIEAPTLPMEGEISVEDIDIPDSGIGLDFPSVEETFSDIEVPLGSIPEPRIPRRQITPPEIELERTGYLSGLLDKVGRLWKKKEKAIEAVKETKEYKAKVERETSSPSNISMYARISAILKIPYNSAAAVGRTIRKWRPTEWELAKHATGKNAGYVGLTIAILTALYLLYRKYHPKGKSTPSKAAIDETIDQLKEKLVSGHKLDLEEATFLEAIHGTSLEKELYENVEKEKKRRKTPKKGKKKKGKKQDNEIVVRIGRGGKSSRRLGACLNQDLANLGKCMNNGSKKSSSGIIVKYI